MPESGRIWVWLWRLTLMTLSDEISKLWLLARDPVRYSFVYLQPLTPGYTQYVEL